MPSSDKPFSRPSYFRNLDGLTSEASSEQSALDTLTGTGDDMNFPLDLVHIVVGFDVSDAAFQAAAWAIGLAEVSGCRVTLVHAVLPGGVFADGTSAAISDAAAQLTEPAPSTTSGVPVDLVVRPGRPEQVIADVAVAVGAGLIVLGDTPAQPPLPGSGPTVRSVPNLASDLVHASVTPVMVVPQGARHVHPDMTWIVGLDGQPGSSEAMLWAFARSEQTAGRLVPVMAKRQSAQASRQTASAPPIPETITADGLFAEPDAVREHGAVSKHGPEQLHGDHEMGPVREQLSLAGIDHRELVQMAGSPPEVLRRVALSQNTPVVVVAGTRSHGLSRFATVGSLAMDLLESPPVPTVIVPYGTVRETVEASAGHRASSISANEVPWYDPSSGEVVVTTASNHQAGDLLRQAEHAGAEASRLRLDTDPMPTDVDAVAANDHANLAGLFRPTARAALTAGLLLAIILGVGTFWVGGGTRAALLAALAGGLVGAILGAFTGLYGNITINRNAIDQKGRQISGTVDVRAGRPDLLDPPRLAGLSYQDEHDRTVRDLTPDAGPGNGDNRQDPSRQGQTVQTNRE